MFLFTRLPVKFIDLSHKEYLNRAYLKFSACNTRSSNIKLIHTRSSNNTSRHFYFNRLPWLWNALPPIDLNLPINTIKSLVKSFLWNYFCIILIPMIFVLTWNSLPDYVITAETINSFKNWLDNYRTMSAYGYLQRPLA